MDDPDRVPGQVTSEISDRDLAERARHDPEAFADLYHRYLPRIRAFAVRRCGDRHLADDITASVFERAWRSLPRVEIPEHGLGPWLYRIAANELASHYRKLGRGQRAQLRLEGAPARDAGDPADAVLLQSDTEALRVALGRLNPRHQEVISLRYLAGLSHTEAAAAMNVSPPALAALLHRAMKALEDAMNDVTEGR